MRDDININFRDIKGIFCAGRGQVKQMERPL